MTAITPPASEREDWIAAREAVGAVLEPKSIAIVGASNTPKKPGNVLLRNILENDFKGAVYPINPNADEVLGMRAFDRIEDVPDDLDSVLFAVPGPIIKQVIPACAKKDVTSVVIISAGFGESVDEDRRSLEDELRALCREHGIRAIGPNTTGMVSMKRDFVASFIPFPRWHDGPIAMGAQSGIFAGVYMEELMAKDVQALGYNYSLALGNKIDIDETDFIRYAAQDEEVGVIQLHVESINDPYAFFTSAANISRKKPIVLLKPGRTPAGREMARYHTGSEPTVDGEVDNACRASGIVRAGNVPEFMNYVKGFSYQPAPRGRRVAVLSLSGANAVMAADYISDSMLELAAFSDGTLETIKAQVPEWQPIRNPVDQWLALPSGPRDAQEIPLKAVLRDESVDAVVTIHLASEEPDFDGIGEVYASARAAHPEKPILSYIMGAQIKQEWIEAMEGTDIPVFDSAYDAIDVLEAMYWWRRYADGVAKYDPRMQPAGKTI